MRIIQAAAICFLLAPDVLEAVEVAVYPATRKVISGAAFPAESTVSIKAARGEWEAFQIVVRSAEGAAGVAVQMDGFIGPGTASISPSNVRLYREKHLNVAVASPVSITLHERLPGSYPDPLVPLSDPYGPDPTGNGVTFDLAPGETAVLYVEVRVPQNAAAGAYSGRAVVSVKGSAQSVIPVSLEVWDFDLPRTVETSFFFDDDALRRFHGGPADPASSDYQTIRSRYYDELHQHRLDPETLYQPATPKFDTGGNLLPIDWTQYDKAVTPFLDGSAFSGGGGVLKFNITRFKPGQGTGSLTGEQYSRVAEAFKKHFEEKDWWDRAYIMTVDEPWMEGDAAYARIRSDVDLLSKYSDGWRERALVTSPYDDRAAGSVGTWCPMTQMYEDWFYTQNSPGRAKYAERFGLGEKLWFYVCNATRPPYAGYDIDTEIGYEPRIAKWGTWYEQASGFLYWHTNYWIGDDPWNVWRDPARFGEKSARNGDGLLIYPGDHDGKAGGKGSPPGVSIKGPVVSYRLKQIRDGLEDWELFRLAEGLGAGEFARREVGRAYRRFGTIFDENCAKSPPYYCSDNQPWTLDEAVLFSARERIARKVLHELYPSVYPDPEEEPDAGSDAGSSDGGYDPGSDSGHDADPDAGPDINPDAGLDAGFDTGPDGGRGAAPGSASGCSCSNLGY